MAVNDVYQVDLLYSNKGEKCANVIHVKETADPGTTNEVHIAEAVKDDIWTAALRATMTNDCTLQTIRVRRIDPTSGGPVMATVDEAGSIAQDTLPPNSAVMLSMYTARLDRSGRGRLFLPGVPKTHNEDGLLPESVVTLYDAVGTALTGTLAESGGTWIVGVWSSTATQFNQFTSWQVRSWIHTLRGRRMAAP